LQTQEAPQGRLRAGLIFCLARAGKGLGKGKPSTSICPDFCQRPVPRFSLAPPVELLVWCRGRGSWAPGSPRNRPAPRPMSRHAISLHRARCVRTNTSTSRPAHGEDLGSRNGNGGPWPGTPAASPIAGATPRENRLSVHRTAWRTSYAILAAIAAVALAQP